ncbi:MAG TPA: RnfABCDGE type electron transport complex subunit D, partial [Ktedonobacteraceae bacterium]|nr:RnfABCDGE type electron transport complex subunit D [Ktedonobacteraceae bacterium]
MITSIDYLLDRVTIYRLVLYVLIGFIALAAILSYVQLLPFSPLALLLSTVFLVVICWTANSLLASIFEVPANVESVYITALILVLIIDPAQSVDNFLFLGWAAVLAISSKYILAFNNKHLFNPAAIAVVITSFALGESASWWVGTASMLPAVILGGVLLVRKLRQGEMVSLFITASLVTVCVVSLLQRLSVTKELQQLLVESPLFFFAAIMLTEPLTAPPTQKLRRIYGVMIGMLFIPQIHVGSIYSTPELALVIGNVYSYIVSPKQRFVLKLKRKSKISSNIVDFIFQPSQRLVFKPGQYMEFTLAHPKPDSRGNRRFFTLASSPTEENLHLGVRFYPNSSSFKKALSKIDSRTKIIAGQIAGDFTL